MSNKELAQLILEGVGGEANIVDVTNCMTRLRFTLKDKQLVNQQLIGKAKGVLGNQFQSGQYQVILGGKVVNVAKEFEVLIKNRIISGDFASGEEQSREGVFSRVINTLATILTPALPPIIAGGMLKGFIVMATNFGWTDGTSDSLMFLNGMSDAMFYFFPFLLAVSSARRFKTNEFMALTIAGVMMYPLALAEGQSFIKLFGMLPIAVVNYSSSVLPIILSVWLLSYVGRFFDRVIPEMVTMVFAPFFTLLVTAPIAMLTIAPLGFYIGDFIATGFNTVIAFSPILAGLLVGITRPILVLGGMHHAMNPIGQQEMASLGYSVLLAMILMSTFAQATAAFVAYFRAKKGSQDKQIAISSVIPGYIGITEPALYGVLAKKKEAMVAACLGGGVGSAVATVFGGKAYGFVMPGVLSLPAFMGDGFKGILLGIVVTLVTTAVVYLVMEKYFDSKEGGRGLKTVPIEPTNIRQGNPTIDIFSPTEGHKVELSQLEDETFSKSILGTTVAIKSEIGKIYAPFSGSVAALFDSQHAIGLTSNAGDVELLIHIGIDTVQLESEYFESHVNQGAIVEQGDLLISFDSQAIQRAGYDDVVLVSVTNSEKYLEIIEYQDAEEFLGVNQTIMKAIK